MGWLKKVFKPIKRFVAPVIGATLGSVIPGIGTALGAALGSGVGAYTSSHNIADALLSAGGSYVGGNLASSIFGNAGGTLIGGLESALGPDLGSFIGQNLGSLGMTSIPSIIGSTVGSDLASTFGAGLTGSAKNSSPQGEGAAPQFKPTQESEMPTMPNFAGLSPFQQSTNLATQGVYGGGQGPGEQSHFLNLINRRLVDETGKVDKDLSEINPIENSYLSQLGLGDMGNPTSLLEAISKRKKAA